MIGGREEGPPASRLFCPKLPFSVFQDVQPLFPSPKHKGVTEKKLFIGAEKERSERGLRTQEAPWLSR